MRRLRFVQLDVFTRRRFCGNPLAVFLDSDELNDEQMQQIAREMNLSETVFVLPARDKQALRRLRIFTPTTELPLAGHPVVGTWNALAREEYGGLVAPPSGGTGSVRIQQELGVGVLPVEIEFVDGRPTRVTMTQGLFTVGAIVTDEEERALIAENLGLGLSDMDSDLPLQTVATGIPTFVVPVRSLAALGKCQPEHARRVLSYARSDAFSLYAFTRETFGGVPAAAHARLFAPEGGIIEDPATGSAAGSLGAYLVHHGALNEGAHRSTDGVYKFTIEQGDFMKRPSRIGVEIAGEAGSIAEVRVGGESVVVVTGELML